MMSKMKFLVFNILLCLVISSMSAIPQKTNASTNLGPLSTWIWNTQSIVTNPDQILAFLSEKQTKNVFLQINYNIKADSYKSFIDKATKLNIEVHALEGAPNWVSNKGNTYADRFFQWVKNYQAQSTPSQRFTGIHLDVEPYLFSGWNSNYNNTVLTYQALMLKSQEMSKQLGLKFGADIPFWFDEKLYNNKYGKGNLAEWVIRNVDVPTIMAYRDHADGPNGINALIKQEVQIAETIGKKLIIAVETLASSEAAYVSFAEEGQAAMFEQLSKVPYGNIEFAIHYLDSWMNMKP